MLSAIVPEGFTVAADGASVTVEAPDGSGATTALDLDHDDAGDLDAYADAGEAVLSFAQDVVCEALDRSWPAASAASVDLPIPGARIDGNVLVLWYGDEAAPVLRAPDLALGG